MVELLLQPLVIQIAQNLILKKAVMGKETTLLSWPLHPVDFSEDLSTLKEELGEHTKVESIGVGDESDDDEEECVYEGTNRLRESYNALREKSEEYARVAKATIRKMKKAEEDYKSILAWYKETKCEVEGLNEELNNAYSKIKFLELEIVQANAKVEHVASKKLDEVLAYQKPSSDRNGLGYTGEGSSNSKVSKETKFVKAKKASTPLIDNVKYEKKPNVVNQMVLMKSPKPIMPKPKARGKSLPKRQRGPQP